MHKLLVILFIIDLDARINVYKFWQFLWQLSNKLLDKIGMISFEKVKDKLDKTDPTTNWYYYSMKHFMIDKY